jgi:hypothetical protein
MTTDLPKTLPVLTEDDFIRGRAVDPHARSRRCLLGHAWHHCGHGNTIAHAMREVLGMKSLSGVLKLNDNEKTPKERLATIWSETALSLGYKRSGNKFVLPKK